MTIPRISASLFYSYSMVGVLLGRLSQLLQFEAHSGSLVYNHSVTRETVLAR